MIVWEEQNFFLQIKFIFLRNCCDENCDDDVDGGVGIVGNTTKRGNGNVGISNDSSSGDNGAEGGGGSGNDDCSSSNGRDGVVNGDCGGEDN